MAAIKASHPLPPPPLGQQVHYQPQYQQQQSQYQQQQYRQQQAQKIEQRPQGRERSKSTFSLRSDRSHKSSGSVTKVDLHESAKEKNARRLSLTTKADPRLAMQEAEPSAVASAQPTSLAPLRAIQHLDATGNPIADPDRSNPTRSRWERPLDTIRSFEAAIDGNYSRKSYMRPETVDSGSGYNRRSTYYGGGPNGGGIGSRHPQDAYNATRPNNFRPDSYVENRGMNHNMSRPDSYYDNNARPSNGYYPSRARYPRTATEPQFNSGTGIYPAPGNQRSYETVTTASGSGSSGDPLGYSTDPSSENSSMDRIQHPAVPEHGNAAYGYGAQNHPTSNYGGNGVGGYYGKQAEAPTMNGGYQMQNGAPPPPRKESFKAPPRVPIKLNPQASTTPGNNQAPRPGVGEKRKSWFKRFSRA